MPGRCWPPVIGWSPRAAIAGDLDFLGSSDRLRAVALDVTDRAAAGAAVAEATSAFGRLDVLVNNAGYIKANAIEDLPEEEFRRQIDVNFFGVYNVTRAVLPVMHGQRDGHIIQISSIGGRRGSPGLGAYQAAKWAVGGFSEVLAREVGPLGIRVTCVEPGGMRTDMFGLSMLAEPLSPDYEPTVGGGIRATFGDPARARSNPAKVARALLRLAEEKQSPVHLLFGVRRRRGGGRRCGTSRGRRRALAGAQPVHRSRHLPGRSVGLALAGR